MRKLTFLKEITKTTEQWGRVFVYIIEKRAYFVFSSEYTHHIVGFVLLEGRGPMPLKFEFTDKMILFGNKLRNSVNCTHIEN